jgi:regulator of replication initiation timing
MDLTMAEKIEKLILDGQKEILGRIDGLSADVGTLKQDVGTLKQDVGTLKQDVGTLKQDVGWIKIELKRIDKKHDVTAQAQYDLLQDVRKEVGEVKEKIDAHLLAEA